MTCCDTEEKRSGTPLCQPLPEEHLFQNADSGEAQATTSNAVQSGDDANKYGESPLNSKESIYNKGINIKEQEHKVFPYIYYS